MDYATGPQSHPLHLLVKGSGDEVTVFLIGELDVLSAPALIEAMDQVASARSDAMVLDVSRLAFVDSAGIHALVQLKRDHCVDGRTLTVSNATGHTREVFRITGLDHVLERPGPLPNCDR